MNDITILHLSDLHINSMYASCSYSLNKMLEDIQNQTRCLKNIVIVVTGDIVHKGNYKCRVAVIDFFTKLYNILRDKVINIFLVPGNHDKIRLPLDNELIRNLLDRRELTGKYFEESWDFHKIPFKEYSRLQEEVYKIFDGNLDASRKGCISDTFGVELLEIEGKKFAFILLNSAWCCTGEIDKRHLRIGKFQIERIANNYKNQWAEIANMPEGVDLTFVMAHHPLSWLMDKEEDFARINLLSKDSLNADVFICGHTHNRDVVNWYNNRHTLTTLTTGFGWPDDENLEATQNHSYSIYVFHLELNSIDIFVRSNDENMNFETDFRIYTNKRDRELSKIVFPIRSYKNQPYIKLHTSYKQNEKVCYLTDNLVNSLKETTKVLADFSRKSESIVNRCKFELLLKIRECAEKGDNSFREEFLELADILWNNEKNKDLRHRYLELFEKHEKQWDKLIVSSLLLLIEQICYQLAHIMNEMAEQRNERVRVHFRYYDWKTDMYLKLYACNTRGEEQTLSDISWGGLIKECFNKKETLINSVNENISHVSMKSHWKNFITVIPNFSQNSVLIEIDGHDEWRPLLTFGISIGNHALDDFLYVFDFLEIDKIIGAIFEEYFYSFPIDMHKYLNIIADRE